MNRTLLVFALAFASWIPAASAGSWIAITAGHVEPDQDSDMYWSVAFNQPSKEAALRAVIGECAAHAHYCDWGAQAYSRGCIAVLTFKMTVGAGRRELRRQTRFYTRWAATRAEVDTLVEEELRQPAPRLTRVVCSN